MPVPRRELVTEHLRLRPSSRSDADRAIEIQSDWDVTRMLSMAAFPPIASEVRAWFETHKTQWNTGDAYRFAIEREQRMIGLADLDGVTGDEATLGYWLERQAWGQGFAFEAASAVVRFAFENLGLRSIKAGHAADNQASGRVLGKLGFRFVDAVSRSSRPRNGTIEQWRYVLER